MWFSAPDRSVLFPNNPHAQQPMRYVGRMSVWRWDLRRYWWRDVRYPVRVFVNGDEHVTEVTIDFFGFTWFFR